METDHTQLFKEDCVTPVGSLATNQVAEGTMVGTGFGSSCIHIHVLTVRICAT